MELSFNSKRRYVFAKPHGVTTHGMTRDRQAVSFLQERKISHFHTHAELIEIVYSSVSQPPGRGPVPGPGINCTRPREVLLEFVILVFYAFFINKYFIVEIF